MHNRTIYEDNMLKKIKIGALISGGGTNLQAIIDACEGGKIDGEMVFIGSDNPAAGGLDRGKKHNIPVFVVDYGEIIRNYRRNQETYLLPEDFDADEIRKKSRLFSENADDEKIKTFIATRAIAEAALLSRINAWGFDLLVLAGFMRNLTPYFIDRVNVDKNKPRIMNIHPALLPSFPGVDGYGDTFRYGCKVGGCTVHFIDYGEDSGPIIGQRAFEIQEDDTLDTIKKKGLTLEWELYPSCIQLFAQGRIAVREKSHLFDNGKVFRRKVTEILARQ